MAETIRTGCGGQKGWLWADIMGDLRRQGGLAGVVIDPLSVQPGSCGGETKKGTKFFISWAHNKYLFLTMTGEDLDLVEAFAKVLEYRPYCRYSDEHGLVTFEWDKEDPDGHFAELEKEGHPGLQGLG